MSRSHQTELIKPCVRFFEWAGSAGELKYYDKELKENVFVELPLTFLVLDKVHTVAGYCDADKCGFWGNEVRDSVRDPITVRTKAGVVASGIWKQLPAITGLKYAQSIYIAFKDENDKLVIGNIKASGAFVSAWIEFCKGKNTYEGAIVITGAVEARKGTTKYYVPLFETRPVKPETDAAAKELDDELQEYLTAYFMRQAERTQEAEAAPVYDSEAAYRESVAYAAGAPSVSAQVLGLANMTMDDLRAEDGWVVSESPAAQESNPFDADEEYF